jgi:hypothetical protein
MGFEASGALDECECYTCCVKRMLAEIERLRAALLCHHCNGRGQVMLSVADSWVPCRHCDAHEIRKGATKAAGGEG